MSSALALLALLSPLAHAAVPSIDGFTLEFSDDFTGAAGSLPDSANWLFTTGTSYPGGAPQFGTGEIETYTANPENVQTDGKGHRKWQTHSPPKLGSTCRTKQFFCSANHGHQEWLHVDVVAYRDAAHRLHGPGRRQNAHTGEPQPAPGRTTYRLLARVLDAWRQIQGRVYVSGGRSFLVSSSSLDTWA